MSDFAPLRLKKNEERRLRAGHLWVYSNEVDIEATPLAGLTPGQAVELQAHNGKPLGTGYANPHSLICARLVSRDPKYPFGPSLLVHRLKVALSLRERLFPTPHYRLVYGESDGLPGLVVDRYGDHLVAQLTTAGMESRKEEVVAALEKVVHPASILWRNDGPLRALEGLDGYVATALGEVPEALELEENGCRFRIAPGGGQKTGWFFDHRDNRARLGRYVKDARVLDLFSYVGGWGVQAAAAGAREVLCIDASAPALDLAEANAELNGVAERMRFGEGDAFEALKQLRADQERFDVVIADPPAFIKRKKDFKEGSAAYHHLNQLAIQVLERDGLLVSCSCSYHLPRERLLEAMAHSAHHLGKRLQLLEQGHQGPDHPVHPSIPESDYLKAFFGRVTPR